MQRRPFLTTLCGATLASTLALHSQEEKSQKKLGWALVGLGSLSTHQIAPALEKCSHSRLAAIVTGTPAKAAAWKEKYKLTDDQIYNYENFDSIIKNPDVDVIYIVLPNSMHCEFVKRAAAAGKHVFCEKPMAVSAAECREMIQACAAAKKQLGIGYRCQFEPTHRAAMRLAREKTLGSLQHICAGFGFKIGDPTQWRLRKKLAGGGALMDVGVYALQATRYLSGEEPTEISAIEVKTDSNKFAEVDETINWQMKFPSGLTAQCITTYNFNGYNYFSVQAEHGKFGMDPAFSYAGLKGHCTGPKNLLEGKDVDHFQLEMDAFSQAILKGENFSPSGEEGLRDLLVIEAIYRSIASGKIEKVAAV